MGDAFCESSLLVSELQYGAISRGQGFLASLGIRLDGAERGTRTPTGLLGPADFKLRRFAGVSEASAEREPAAEIPSAFCEGSLLVSELQYGAISRGQGFLASLGMRSWCREGDSNPHRPFG